MNPRRSYSFAGGVPNGITYRIVPRTVKVTVNRDLGLFAQDKWKIDARTTLSIGFRYDLEIIPLDETGNPLFGNGRSYPVDKNNVAPRIGFTRAFDDAGKSVIRAGYGMFYNRTILGAIDDVLEFSKFTTSNVVNFPSASADPGPGRTNCTGWPAPSNTTSRTPTT